jgi:hypothetical protein
LVNAFEEDMCFVVMVKFMLIVHLPCSKIGLDTQSYKLLPDFLESSELDEQEIGVGELEVDGIVGWLTLEVEGVGGDCGECALHVHLEFCLLMDGIFLNERYFVM